MRCFFVTTALLLAAVPAGAAEGKLNALTPQEIADGWISLFDGETTFGWTFDGPGVVKERALLLGGEIAKRASLTAPLGNCELTLEFLGQVQLVLSEGGSSNSTSFGN